MAGRPRHVALDPGLRPLDRLGSIKIKLGVLVSLTVTAAAFLTWVGLRAHLGPSRTFPLVIAVSLLVTQVLAHGMTAPLRQMRSAATAMADGDYSRRVTATSHDEVGDLAAAFNQMASDLAREDAARRALVANVSHELRTPVAALRAQLENLADGVTPATPEELERALDRTESLSELISYLLDLSRLDAGATELERRPLDLVPLLTQAVDTASEAAAAAGRSVVWEVDLPGSEDDGTPALGLLGDAARLRQVFVNLLDNAGRHTAPGSTVLVRARRAPGRSGVVVDVVDHGPGIARAERARVFNRFERGAGVDSAGTGLGLSIARWAVGLHGGTIGVVDAPSPLGAVVRVRLPGHGGAAPGTETLRTEPPEPPERSGTTAPGTDHSTRD